MQCECVLTIPKLNGGRKVNGWWGWYWVMGIMEVLSQDVNPRRIKWCWVKDVKELSKWVSGDNLPVFSHGSSAKTQVVWMSLEGGNDLCENNWIMTEGCWMNPLWGTGVCIVKLLDFDWSSYVWFWDPRVFLISIPFPFYQELELASCKSAIQNSLHYIVFFSIHHFQW